MTIKPPKKKKNAEKWRIAWLSILPQQKQKTKKKKGDLRWTNYLFPLEATEMRSRSLLSPMEASIASHPIQSGCYFLLHIFSSILPMISISLICWVIFSSIFGFRLGFKLQWPTFGGLSRQFLEVSPETYSPWWGWTNTNLLDPRRVGFAGVSPNWCHCCW